MKSCKLKQNKLSNDKKKRDKEYIQKNKKKNKFVIKYKISLKYKKGKN